MYTNRSLRTSFLLVLFLLAAPAAHGAERFYMELLEDGVLAADRGDAVRAVKVLRLACFGMLEEPPLLARCLTHLALAQAQLDDQDEFRATFDRLVRLERRFGAFAEAEVTSADRRTLAIRADEILTEEGSESLATLGLAALVEPPASTGGDEVEPSEAGFELAAVETESADPEPPVSDLPSNGDAPPSHGDTQSRRPEPEMVVAEAPEEVVEETIETPPPPEPPAPPPPAPEPAPPEEDFSEILARAQEIKRSTDRAEIHAFLDRLRPLALESQNRELQYLAAEVAYRLRLWEESRDFFERGGFDESRPELTFLFAVTLYETGKYERAALVLETCLEQLERTPFVESYIEKITAAAPRRR